MLFRRIEDGENFTVDCTAAATQGATELPSMSELISPEERRQFLKKLFGGDQAGFDKFCAELESAADWSEAHRYIMDHFYEHSINPYIEEASRFSGLVYKRYFPTDMYV